MRDLARSEFHVLRDTIRSRGGARPIVLLAGLVAWATLLLAVLAWLPLPLASLIPLMVLLATFEAIRTLHAGVERIGRYLQVFFEQPDAGSSGEAPAWEHTAMAFGPVVPGAGGHPLFLPLFLLAAVLNFTAVLLPDPVSAELGALSVPHLAFVIWLLHCDRGMRKQRGVELARFQQLRSARGRAERDSRDPRDHSRAPE
jgi:hypothetical protein